MENPQKSDRHSPEFARLGPSRLTKWVGSAWMCISLAQSGPIDPRLGYTSARAMNSPCLYNLGRTKV